MQLGWKVFIPLTLGWLIFVAGILVGFDSLPNIIYI
jgi:NADH:ubiquinone oxidoreductase subunit H